MRRHVKSNSPRTDILIMASTKHLPMQAFWFWLFAAVYAVIRVAVVQNDIEKVKKLLFILILIHRKNRIHHSPSGSGSGSDSDSDSFLSVSIPITSQSQFLLITRLLTHCLQTADRT